MLTEAQYNMSGTPYVSSTEPVITDGNTFLGVDTINTIPRGPRTLLITTISVLIIFSNIVNLIVLKITEQIPLIIRICLLNLSFADLFVGLLSCVPCIYPAITGVWPYGAVWCQIAGITHGMSVTMSIWSLAFVSVDRYLAILHPLHYNQLMTPFRCKKIIISLWIIAFVTFFLPVPTKSNFIYYQFMPDEMMCGLYWEYAWFCVITAIYIPVLSGSILLFTTIRIAKEVIALQKLRQSQVAPDGTSGNNSEVVALRINVGGQFQIDVQPQRKKTKRLSSKELRPVKVLAVTAVVYFTVWGPYVTQVVLLSFFKQLHVPTLVRFITIWLANSNSFMNVFIYSVMYTGFRHNAVWLMKLIVARLCCRDDPKPVIQSTTRRDGSTIDGASQCPPYQQRDNSVMPHPITEA